MPEPRDASSRSQIACDGCRRRKVKCDSAERGAGKPCSKCEASEIECKFTYTRKKRRPNLAPKSRKYGVDTVQILVENIVTALDEYSIPQDPESVREMLISLAKYARSLELRMNHSAQSGSSTTTDSSLTLSGDSVSPESSNKTPQSGVSDTSDKEDSDDEQLLEEFKTLTIGPQQRHFGRSSNYLFLHAAMKIGNGEIKTRNPLQYQEKPEMWSTDIWKWVPEPETPHYTFPEDDLLWDLIKVYFEEVSPFSFPVLHEPTFKRAVSSGLHLVDHNFGATVLAVCALASRHSDDPRNYINPTDYEQLIGWKWFRQIQLLRPSFVDTVTLYELQLYCLSYSYLGSTTIADTLWPLIGLGIRSSQERGIHRAKPGPRTVENELWVRAFWCLVGLDIIQGITVGRPPATTPNDFDIDQIAECDDEYWESSEPFVQPQGKPSVSSFGVHYNKLIQIAGSIQRSIYAVKRPDLDQFGDKSSHGGSIEWNQRQVIKHDSALNEWLDSLPEHLRWDPHRADPIFFQQTVVLHHTFYFVQMTLHKKFVMRIAKPLNVSSDPDSSPEMSTASSTACSTNKYLANLEMRMSFPSLAVCANAARCTVNISQAHHQRKLHPLPWTLMTLSNAASVLLVALWRSKHSTGSGSATSRKEWADLQKSFALLSSYENRHQAAGRIVDKFYALVKAEDLDSIPDPPQTSGKKRSRPDEPDSLDLDWPAAAQSYDFVHQQGYGYIGSIGSDMIQIQNKAQNFSRSSNGVSGVPDTPRNGSFATNPDSARPSWSNPATVGVPDGLNTVTSNSFGIGVDPPASVFGNGLSTVGQNQTRPLDVSEVKNGVYDELYHYVGNGNMPSMFNGTANPSNGGDSDAIQQLLSTGPDLDDWNTFMKNVDDALFEVGIGR
ncbi:fungal-specific transcription factor domain-containing protein [Lentinula raphanica]|uniref:Fungal-specific transcription factor domain-containing protein n=1 Tax=Lentinula raphanica TaxID=153919 RepID=A0AA38UDS8_9AGAR|nr:fungal-specific transcription factor domain-containing protein [Lentinula raphanica]